jgi:hypothetical protein
MTCTLVSAYYNIKSKFSKDQYVEWMRTFLKIESPMVIFTETKMEPVIRTLREDRPLHLIILPFDKLTTWSLYKDQWIAQHQMDPEKHIHTPELYSIWAEKAFLVERAIQMNPFQTDFFFWCDMGAFRDPHIDPLILQTFPTTTYLSQNHLLLQSIGDLTDHEKIPKEDGIYGECISHQWNEVRLVGGLWGGGARACLLWKNAYQQMLERYFQIGRFAGKDQQVMLSTYLDSPSLAHIIRCTTHNINPWFFLPYLLSHRNERYEENNSYQMYPSVMVAITGGLGNQLFQIAAGYAYARKEKGHLQLFHTQDNGNRHLYWNSVLYRMKPYITDSFPSIYDNWDDPQCCSYYPIPALTNKNMYLKGYYQSSKYLYSDEIKREIRQLFSPHPDTLQEIYRKYNYLIENADRVIVVHARRTDYLKNETNIMVHGPLNASYYKEAIQRMKIKVKDPIWLLTSDDNRYWIDIEKDLGIHSPIILMNESDVHSFTLLQQFKHYIISNSTFIWWAAWMADAPHVIVPSKWFGPWGSAEYEDIYEPHWERI